MDLRYTQCGQGAFPVCGHGHPVQRGRQPVRCSDGSVGVGFACRPLALHGPTGGTLRYDAIAHISFANRQLGCLKSCSVSARHYIRISHFSGYVDNLLLLSLGKQCEQRGRKAQKVILRGPFARRPAPFAHSSAPSRCSCGSHRSARPPLGSENTRRSSGAASPCGCLALPGCCQRAR